MWSDTLLRVEQLHLARLMLWGALNVLVGTALLAATAAGRLRSPLLRRFGLAAALLGVAELAIAGWGYLTLGLHDVAGAARLERLLWFELGLFLGVALAGTAVAVTGWRLARRPGVVGAGTAVAVHGLALAVLDLYVLAVVSR